MLHKKKHTHPHRDQRQPLRAHASLGVEFRLSHAADTLSASELAVLEGERSAQAAAAKEARLRSFPDAVRQRVTTIEKAKITALAAVSLRAVQREQQVMGRSDYDDRVRRNPQVVRGGGPQPSFVGIPSSARVNQAEEAAHQSIDELANSVHTTMQHARTRLMRSAIDPAAASALPGGIWSQSRALQYAEQSVEAIKEHGASFALGCDKPIESPSMAARQAPTHTLIEQGVASQDLVDARGPLASMRPAGVIREEDRRQARAQLSMYRRLFMDMERDQVRESARQRDHERRMALLVADKEAERERAEMEANGAELSSSAVHNIDLDQQKHVLKAQSKLVSGKYIVWSGVT